MTIEPVGAFDKLPLTATALPATPEYGPPAFATGATTSGGEDDSPDALYALTAIVWLPPENGNATEQPHAPFTAGDWPLSDRTPSIVTA